MLVGCVGDSQFTCCCCYMLQLLLHGSEGAVQSPEFRKPRSTKLKSAEEWSIWIVLFMVRTSTFMWWTIPPHTSHFAVYSSKNPNENNGDNTPARISRRPITVKIHGMETISLWIRSFQCSVLIIFHFSCFRFGCGATPFLGECHGPFLTRGWLMLNFDVSIDWFLLVSLLLAVLVEIYNSC